MTRSSSARVALQLVVRLAQVERADVADRHQRVAARRLGVREDAGVQVQVVVRLRLVDVARAAARDRLQLDQLQPHLRREGLRRDVELLRRERREAALVVRDFSHALSFRFVDAEAPLRSWPVSCSSRESARSPWTIPSAPSRPCSLTRS